MLKLKSPSSLEIIKLEGKSPKVLQARLAKNLIGLKELLGIFVPFDRSRAQAV